MRKFGWIWILLVCFVAGGATCSRRKPPLPMAPPAVELGETPSRADVVAVVNRTQAIRQLSSNSASVRVLSMPKLPRLGATLNLERERRFRLRASLPIVLGAGMDLGSNDEVFWFEVPEGMSKTLYFARHDQYRQQLHRAIFPVDPTWVMDALGLVQIDPESVVAAPVRRGDGKLEIRELLTLPDGVYQRVCLIEPSAGYVTHQSLSSPSGQLIAQSLASNHVYYEAVGCALPHRVELTLTPSVGPPLAMRIEVGSYTVNQLLSNDPQLFTMPAGAGQAVDLTTLSAPPSTTTAYAPPSSAIQPLVAPPAAVGAPPISYSSEASRAYPFRGMQ